MIDDNIFWKGVRHIYSPNTVSKYDLCVLTNNTYSLNIKINKVDDKVNVNKH